MDTLRGHKIEMRDGFWVFSDTGDRTIDTWRDRPCGHCGRHDTPEGHDACLGALPDVINACCGHGDDRQAYVTFTDGSTLRHAAALSYFAAIRAARGGFAATGV